MKTVLSRAGKVALLRLSLFFSLLGGLSAVLQGQTTPTNPPPPTVTIRAADAYATEPCGMTTVIDGGVFVISRTTYTNLDLTVHLAIAGKASNGVDYVKIPEEVVIPKGRRSVEIFVNPLPDNAPEGVEGVVVRIKPIMCIAIYPPPPECYQVGQPAEAVVHIADCELQPQPSVVTIHAPDPYAAEPCASNTKPLDPGVFILSRTGDTNINLPVRVALTGVAQNGVDYMRITNQWVIPAGRWKLEVPVKPLADALVEGPENVVARVLPPFCPETVVPLPPECYRVGQPAEAAVYIRDCPSALPMVRITRPENGQQFPAPATIPIRAQTVDPDGYCWRAEFFNGTQKIGEQAVSFYVAPTNGTMVPFEFTWNDVPDGDYVLRVKATDHEGNVGVSEPVKIMVGSRPPPTNLPPVINVVATDPLAIEGTNCWSWWNETNRYPVASAQEPVYSAALGSPIWWFTNCGPKNATFTIRRSGGTNDDLRVFYELGGTAVNGLDYELLPKSAVIPAGSRTTEVLIVPKEDDAVEKVETVVLGLRLPPDSTSLLPPYVIGLRNRAGAAIVDSSNPRLPTGPLPDRSFYVGKNAVDGSWYRIERSADLDNWNILCTNQVLQGSVHYVDPDAAETDKLFYRAVPVSVSPEAEP